eukprot:1182538-Prorocentrum_minimum.AAC.1
MYMGYVKGITAPSQASTMSARESKVFLQPTGFSEARLLCSKEASLVSCPNDRQHIEWKSILQGLGEYSYLQVGAHTGVSRSDPLGFLRSSSRGVLVEPVRENFLNLQRNFRKQISDKLVVVHNLAICEQPGSMMMYAIDAPDKLRQRLPDYATQLASLNKTHLLNARERIRQKSGGIDIEPLIKGRNVTCVTIGGIIRMEKQFLKNLSLVVIDAEGFDARIVQMMLDANVCPSLIVYEHAHLSPVEIMKLRRILVDHHYSMSSFSKMDTIAVRCA